MLVFKIGMGWVGEGHHHIQSLVSWGMGEFDVFYSLHVSGQDGKQCLL